MHEGHRQRMYEKLVGGDNLFDHEILEILLFNAIPRKNTNFIAHNLLDRFGSIYGVFNASTEELKMIDGVGESTACFLKCVGECIKRIPKEDNGIAVLKTPDDIYSFVRKRMRGKKVEELEIYVLSKSSEVSRIFSYTSYEEHTVSVNIDKLAKDIGSANPFALILAHNHLSGNSTPSAADDHFTKLVQILCSINNIQLYDHCIYAGEDNIYSYHRSGKIDGIKLNYSINSLIRAQDNATDPDGKER